ncbi:MAG: hypothetical protein L3J24_12035 [Xanthomonadales bacterium]|nr:hypothetical protein [Xanthomonadales bacterium]
MNIKAVISIVILISLALIAYVFLDIGKAVKINNPIENKAVENKVVGNKAIDNRGTNNTEQIATKTSQLIPLEQVSAEIMNFNEQLAIDLSLDYSDESVRINAVRFLEEKQRYDSADVIEEINEYFENIVENQIEVSDLVSKCKRANKKLAEHEKILSQPDRVFTERLFNRYYFFQGLLESNICNDAGTRRDPFFVFLNSARKGNMLSQLLLTDHLVSALARKLIDPWKYPLEYMGLRTEAVYYLKILASKGVLKASEKLAHMYSSSSYFMPRDRVWEYYYMFLYEKQGGLEGVYVNSSKLYYYLTDEQKIIVDRMTENL